MCSGNSFKRFAKTQGTTCGRKNWSVDDFYMQLFSLKIWEIALASSQLLPLQQRVRRTALLLRFGCSCNPLKRVFAGTTEKLANR